MFQLVHLILTDFKWEEDALMRAKKLYGQGHDMTVNSLEGTWPSPTIHRSACCLDCPSYPVHVHSAPY